MGLIFFSLVVFFAEYLCKFSVFVSRVQYNWYCVYWYMFWFML